jgi:hypothetical protein
MALPLAWLTTERDWPWRDSDVLGWPGLLIVASLLTLLTLWTYSGQRQVGWLRLFTILGLRLAALAVVLLLILRPTFASEQDTVTPGRLIIVLDCSLSMKIADSPKSSTRWDHVRKLLEWPEVKDALEYLKKEKQIDIVFYQAAEDVRPYDPASDADGKRTDIGKWLHELLKKHRNDRNLRGLLLFTDGADNGTRYPVFDEAAAWRELPCPIQPFGAGSETTKEGQKDIALVDVDVKADRDHIYVKSKVPIKAVVDAPNMEGQTVQVSFLVDGKQVGDKKAHTLPNPRGNVIDVGTFVPETVGEVKITVKIDEVPGEFTTLNNEMSTYVTVRKEGLSVLWVDRERDEATPILSVLMENPRLSIIHDVRRRDTLTPQQLELLSSKTFDVVVIGDVTARRFSGGDDAALARLAENVKAKKTGLLMLGGAQSLGNKDWPTTGGKIAAVLPVELSADQVEGSVGIEPVAANKGHRLVQLGISADKLWGQPGDDDTRVAFLPLRSGCARAGTPRQGALALLATTDATKAPVFVVSPDDGPRVAVFSPETTYMDWRRSDDAVRAYGRFWSQLIAWLARQEEGSNQVWIKLDKRRIAVGANQELGFSVGAVGKDGMPMPNVKFEVKVEGPDRTTTVQTNSEQRGAFKQADAVGEYKATVTAKIKGPNNTEVVVGSASARFMGYAEDVENQNPAANHKDLVRLAAAGGGTFRIAGKEELLQYLNDLRDHTAAAAWVKREVWPNWKAAPASDAVGDQVAALLSSLMLPCLVLFVLCVCGEWFLRRWWGLV